MTYWMDNEQENRRSLQNLVDPLAPVPVDTGPGFTEGALAAPFRGAWHGYSALATVVGDPAISGLQELSEPIDDVLGTNATEWLEGQREKSHDIVRRYRVDPNTTGEVGRILHGAASVVTQAAVGSIATGGTAGAAIAAGAGTGYEEYNQLIESGVDPETAKRVAGITAVDTAVGVALPMTIGGGVWGAMAWGAGTNVATGAAGRYDSGKVLAEAGYTEMAEQYKALDGVAMATDVLMGSAFPVAGHLVNKARARLLPGETLADRLTPEQVDAVDVAARQYHDDVETSPGLHKSPESMNAHHEATRLMEDEVLVNGKDPSEVNLDPIIQRMDLEPDARPFVEVEYAGSIIYAEAPEAARAEAAARVKEPEQARAVKPAVPATAPSPPRGTEGSIDLPLPRDQLETAPVGAWVESGVPDMRGRSIAQIQEVPVEKLYLPELDENGRLQPEKRKYLPEYVEKLKAGEKAPTIHVIEMEDGRLRVVDGHRRVMAAREVGNGTIRAEVSPLIDTPEGKVPLTKELAQAEADKPPVPVVDPTDTVAVAKAGDISSMDQAATAQAIDAMPDMTVPHPDTGKPVSARELMAELDREIETAKQDGDLASVAVACFKTFGD